MWGNVFLLLLCAAVSYGMCPYIDAYWKVNYHRGLVKYDPENLPDPPTVSQVGHGDLEVRWGHLIYDKQCVDRYIIHAWDIKARLVRYIFNSSSTVSAIIPVPMCTKMKIQVELQEDDIDGQLPDSEMTFPVEAALTTTWLDTPFINTNRSQVVIEKTFSHWTNVFNSHYLKGIFVSWEGMVLNPECITDARVIVTRLVKGRLSDSTKIVVVPVPDGHENITLVLPCEDALPYTLQIELVEAVKVRGRKKRFAERSEMISVPLICPWSEPEHGASGAEINTIALLLIICILMLDMKL